MTPLGAEESPWDVTWAAVILASDEARWISSVILPVDCGLFTVQPLLSHEIIEASVHLTRTGMN